MPQNKNKSDLINIAIYSRSLSSRITKDRGNDENFCPSVIELVKSYSIPTYNFQLDHSEENNLTFFFSSLNVWFHHIKSALDVNIMNVETLLFSFSNYPATHRLWNINISPTLTDNSPPNQSKTILINEVPKDQLNGIEDN